MYYYSIYPEETLQQLEEEDIEEINLRSSDDVVFRAGKERLALFSTYFNDLFGLEMFPLTTEDEEHKLEDIHSDELFPILMCLEGGSLFLHIRNVYRVLRAATLLGIRNIEYVCEVHLQQNITTDNAITIFLLADMLNNPRLQDFAQLFILDNFRRMRGQLLHVPLPILWRILTDSTIRVSENEILQLLAEWSLLNMAEAPFQLWEDILTGRRTSRLAATPSPLPLQLPDTVQQLSSVIFMFGGTNPGVENSCMAYNPAVDAITELSIADPPFPWVHMGVVYHDRTLYLCGGEARPQDGSQPRQQFWQLSLFSLQWTQLPSTTHEHLHAAIALVGDSIYALGGQDGEGRPTASVERFDIESGEWISLPPMEEARTQAAAVVLGSRIFLIGGSDGQNSLCSVAILDTTSGQWSLGCPMPMPRSQVRAAIFIGGWVVVAGGSDRGTAMRTCLTADLAGNMNWRKFRRLNRPRQGHSFLCVDGKFLVAVCGDGPGFELMENQKGEWERLQNRNEDWTGCGACTVPLSALGSRLVDMLQTSWTQ